MSKMPFTQDEINAMDLYELEKNFISRNEVSSELCLSESAITNHINKNRLHPIKSPWGTVFSIENFIQFKEWYFGKRGPGRKREYHKMLNKMIHGKGK